jgi:predicted PolB exonuclease-like 3'-5' exonuclease
MGVRTPEQWLEIAVWQELLDGWQTHKGNRNAAHADLQARFGAALGTDFDLCVYDGVDSADALYNNYLTKHKLKHNKLSRQNFRNRGLAKLRDAWVATMD